MTKLREDAYREALLLIRDSTFRNAMQLRAIAQRALEADDPIPYLVTNAGRTEASKCWCETCRPLSMDDMRFIVCPDCGNKRCPKANFHEHACTSSNEVGQAGSAWENVKPLTEAGRKAVGGEPSDAMMERIRAEVAQDRDADESI